MQDSSKLVVLVLILVQLLVVSADDYPPSDPSIFYSGRVNENYTFEWSGVSIQAAFSGTSVTAKFQDQWGQNELNVFVDDAPVQVVNLTTDVLPITVSGLSSGSHNILITKRTEANAGYTTFLGFTVDPGCSLIPFGTPQRKIEFIGDSITCGYGDEGVFPCHFSYPTENNYLSYGPVTARNLDAQLYLEAWSGMGVVRNYGDPNTTSTTPFPALYPYVLPGGPSDEWDFSKFIPDVVVINLGTNDYSTQPFPPQDVFEAGYVKFVTYLQQNYNSVPHFFLVCGPMENSVYCPYTQNVASTVGATYVSVEGLLDFPADFGCDYHPAVSGHAKMAANITAAIKSVMGW